MTQPATTAVYGSGIAINNGGNYITVIYGLDWLIDLTITRLNTPFLFYNNAYGIDIAAMINKAFNGDSTAWAQSLKKQILLDPRIVGCDVAASLSLDGTTLTTNVQCTTSVGDSFALVNVSFPSIPISEISWSAQ